MPLPIVPLPTPIVDPDRSLFLAPAPIHSHPYVLAGYLMYAAASAVLFFAFAVFLTVVLPWWRDR